MDLRASTIWITGASTGIGQALCVAFAREGARVIASARNPQLLSTTVAAITEGEVHALPCDVSSATEVGAAHQRILEQFGPVHALINNAGTTVFRSFMDTSVEDFDRLTATNLRGSFLTTKAVLPGMVERGDGTIVMVSSMAAVHAFPDSSVYSAGKAGLKAMADCLRLEVRKSGVRVITVYPGATNTPIWPERVREKHGVKMMSPDDVAASILHACTAPLGVMIEEIRMQPIGGGL